MRLGRKAGDPDAPDAAYIMLQTRQLNQWLGTNYTLDEVANDPVLRDPMVLNMMGAIQSGLTPPDQKSPKEKRRK